MKKNLVLLLLFSSLVDFVYAQNLVMNPSFEEYWDCPTQTANAKECKWIFDPQCIEEPLQCWSSSDYFNSCAPTGSNVDVPFTFCGFQNAKTGDAFVGILNFDQTGYREYVQIKLKDKLIQGMDYSFSFNINLSDYSHYTTDAIGVKFVTDSAVYFGEYLWEFMQPDWLNTPGNFVTDTVDWTEMEGTYTAQGGEEWLIIGVFYPEMVYPTILADESTPQPDGNCYFFLDDIYVSYPPLTIPNVFTPNGDGANDFWQPKGSVINIIILNRWGNVVFQSSDNSMGWDGTDEQGKHCESGVYFYILEEKDEFKKETIRHSGFISLLR